MTFTAENILLVGAIILFISIMISKTGFKYGVPTLLTFLLVGMFFGIDGIGFHFNDYKQAQFVGMVALSIILFSGGLDTKVAEIKPIIGPGIMLSTMGVLLTTVFTGFFIWGISKLFATFEVSLLLALLLAATMSSTDSATVFNILRSQRMKLRNNLQPMLEFESGSNDPMAYLLTIAMIQVIMSNGSGDFNVWHIVVMFFVQFAVGLIIGFLMGKLFVWIINKAKLHNKSLYPILVLCFIFFTFSFTDLLNGNGYLAVYIAGIVLGNQKLAEKREIDSFLNGLVWLVQIIMFLVLGLLVNPHELTAIALPAIVIAVFMVIFARPISVWICLLPFRKIFAKDKLFISWVGLRGAVPIIFATYPVVANIEGSNIIFNIAFFITLLSMLVQGTTIPLFAKWLDLGVKADDIPKNFGVEIPEELNTRLEQEIVEEAALLKDYPIKDDVLVILVRRNHKHIVPKGNLQLQKGDILLLLSTEEENQNDENHPKKRKMLKMPFRKRLK